MTNPKRYSQKLVLADVPQPCMVEDSAGMWVQYRDYQALEAKLDAFMLEYEPESMTPDQLRKWSEHQRPV